METQGLIFVSLVKKGIFVLIKNVTWKDPFTDEERTREFYFHVGMGDLTRVEMEFGFKGGMEGVAKAVLEARDAPAIISLFEKLIAMSYGRKTDDGDFVKKKEWTEEFIGGRAYDALFAGLVSDSVAASEFFNGIMPPEVRKKVKELQKADNTENVQPPKEQTPHPAVKQPFDDPGPTIGKATVTEHEGGLSIDVTKNENLEPSRSDPTEFDPFRKPLKEYTYDELVALPYDDFDRLMRSHKGQLPRALLNLRYQRDLAQEKR